MHVLDKFRMDGYCSIVTGAAMGLGKAMASALADVGSDIVIADIDPAAANKTAEEFRKKGVAAQVVRTDITNAEEVNGLVRKVMDDFGRVDVLINNAGICKHEKAENMDYKDWSAVMDVNLNGTFLMSQAVGREMIKRGKGSIVNIASMSGVVVNTPQCQCAYNVSKAGVIMLTKSLAAEWAPYHVRVNSIAPGYMKTELTRPYFEKGGDMVKRWMDFSPMQRPGTPDELEGIAVYLASEASSFVTGGTFAVDGGYTVW